MSRISKLIMIGLSTLAPILPMTAWSQSTPQAIVRIGFNYPQSGPYAGVGLSQYQGATLAADEINHQGGIRHRRIELVTRDSGSHVRKTRGNVRALLDHEKVHMIFGGVSSDVAIAACSLCQEKWVPFFGTLTYSTATTGEDAHRACFRESSNSWMTAKLLAGYMKEHFAEKRYFYITADYNYGWTTEQSLRKLTGTTNRHRHPGIRARLGTANFIEPLRQVQAVAPDVLILTLGGMDLTTALRQATVMGLKSQCRIVIPNIMSESAVGTGPKAMEGVIGTLPWSWRVPYFYQYPRGIEFVERYKARFKDYPTSAAASAYTILYEYKAAVERAGSFDGPQVIRALEGHTYQIVKNPQTWRKFDHQSIQEIYLVRGKAVGDDPTEAVVQDYFEIIDSMPGRENARTHEEWLAVRRKAGKPDTLEKIKPR